jgi:hypothetical protein
MRLCVVLHNAARCPGNRSLRQAASANTLSEAQPVQSAMLIAVRHQSMEQIPTKAILSALPAYLQGCDYTEIVIDQCDLFRNGRLIDPQEAARRQRDVEKQVAMQLARHPEAHLARAYAL